MTDLTEMVEWLRRTIEGDKAAAEVCAGVPWVIDVPPMIHVDAKAIAGHRHAWRKLGYVGTVERDHDRQHIVRHDPRDTIARCEAELEIIDEHALMYRVIGWLDEEGEETYEELEVCARCVAKHSHYATRADVPTGPCRTIRLLVSGYRHRDGYKASWSIERLVT